MKIHFVKAGETLYEIGKKYGVTVEEIVAVNKTIIDPNLIMVGMKIIIPEKQMQTSVHEPMQAPIPADIIMPSIPHYPVNEATTPQHTMPINQTMPEQHIMPINQTMPEQHTMPMNQTMPAQQTMPINQTMPAQQMPVNQTMPAQQMPINQTYPNFSALQQPVYPNQAIPPFAAFPVPAQQVTAPINASTIPTWSMPTHVASYNTPYHMTNYAMPYASNPNPNPNPSYQGMVQSNSSYEPYAANAMPYAANEMPYTSNAMPYSSNGSNEYYNTYHSLNYYDPWSSHNSQPHAQMYEPQSANNPKENKASMENNANEEILPQQGKEKARTSSTSTTMKQTSPIKSKKNTLHDQVMRLHKRRNRR